MTAEDGPTVSVVTPVYNGETYLLDAIESVHEQTYEAVEHIVVDGGSTDDTVHILDAHEDEYGYRWISEPDDGMYHAIEKGFSMASGEIYGWLNADDMFLPWTLELVVERMNPPQTEWLTGVPAYWDANGRLTRVAPFRPHYKRSWLRRGWYHGRALGFVQQEGTFWTADLWSLAGGFPDDVQLAGDFYLWKQFAEHAELKTIPTVLAGFRRHPEQFTDELSAYYAEVDGPNAVVATLLRVSQLQVVYSFLRMSADG